MSGYKDRKNMCAMLGGIDIKMMYKCIKPHADALLELNYDVASVVSSFYCNAICCITHQQIRFEDRFQGDMDNDCLMSVNGTDFRIAASFQKSMCS